jgi:branched-chain amino acid transport system substrate-binding protein
VALLAEKNDVGLASRQAIAAQLDKAKIPYDTVDADPTLTDFTAQILRFKSVSPPYDMFCTEFSEAGAYDMVRQAKELGFALNAKCGMYNSGGSAVDPTFWQNVKETGVYLCTENVGLPKAAWNDKTKAFAKAFADKFKTSPPGAVMEAYDGLYLLADAIQRAGGTDAKGIIHALETTSYFGTRGQYSFSTSHDPAWHYHQFLEAPLTLIEYSQENQPLDDAPIIWPRKFATVKETYIRPPA